jgi:hypothetical protein
MLKKSLSCECELDGTGREFFEEEFFEGDFLRAGRLRRLFGLTSTDRRRSRFVTGLVTPGTIDLPSAAPAVSAALRESLESLRSAATSGAGFI